jgi:hypothetical protein
MIFEFIKALIILNVAVTIFLFIDGQFGASSKETKRIFKYVYIYGNICIILFFVFEDYILIMIEKMKVIINSLFNS